MPTDDFETEKQRFRDHYADNIQAWLAAEASISALLALLLADHQGLATPTVESRIKEREECIKKFGRKYQKQLEDAGASYEIRHHITDLLGFRVVCLYESDIEVVQDVVAGNFDVIGVTDKTDEAEGKTNTFGYKGLHLDVRINALRANLPEYKQLQDLSFEVQIRTIVQDAWSTLDHKIKYKRNIPDRLARRINRLSALFELADQEFLNIRNETRQLERDAAENGNASQSDGVSKTDSITPFEFLSVGNKLFSGYRFLAPAIDGFVDELNGLTPVVTSAMLEASVKDSAALMQAYKAYQSERFRNRLNPFTTIRHALYLQDPENYSSLLRDLQRKTFDEWRLGQINPGTPPV